MGEATCFARDKLVSQTSSHSLCRLFLWESREARELVRLREEEEKKKKKKDNNNGEKGKENFLCIHVCVYFFFSTPKLSIGSFTILGKRSATDLNTNQTKDLISSFRLTGLAY